MRRRFMTPFALVLATIAAGHTEANANVAYPNVGTSQAREVGVLDRASSPDFDFVLKNSEAQEVLSSFQRSHRSHRSHSSHRSHYSSRR